MEILSNRGKKKFLTDDGYLFIYGGFSRKDPTTTFWRCEKKQRCKARIHTKDGRLLKIINPHCHLPSVVAKGLDNTEANSRLEFQGLNPPPHSPIPVSSFQDIPTSTRDDLPTLVRRINRLPPSIQDELPATMNNINSKSPAKQGQSKIIKTENEVVVKKRKLSNDEVERNESRAFCPRETVVKLGKFMYDSDWAVGNGGGITIRDGENLYMEPSCVAKDRIKVEDLFVTDLTGKVLSHPDNEALKLTQCSPLFMNAYLMRDAGAVIHSHAQCACLATLICKGAEFCISHLEMLKGIKKATTGLPYNYDEVLKIPIIENTLFEKELKNRMQVAMDMYPDTNAVLVRRHGVYIWGDSWEQAKSMAECYHYLFKMALEMHRMGMKFDVEPTGESGFTD